MSGLAKLIFTSQFALSGTATETKALMRKCNCLPTRTLRNVYLRVAQAWIDTGSRSRASNVSRLVLGLFVAVLTRFLVCTS